MVKYKCVNDGRIYSEDQMRDLFRFKKYRGYTGTFEDWIKSELDNGYIINYTDKKSDKECDVEFDEEDGHVKQKHVSVSWLDFECKNRMKDGICLKGASSSGEYTYPSCSYYEISG